MENLLFRGPTHGQGDMRKNPEARGLGVSCYKKTRNGDHDTWHIPGGEGTRTPKFKFSKNQVKSSGNSWDGLGLERFSFVSLGNLGANFLGFLASHASRAQAGG